MPIRTLEPFTEPAPLDALKNTIVGIDVQHYITNLLPANIDPTFEAIGGFPLSLKERILKDAKAFDFLGMKAIFVFPGLRTINQYNYIEQSGLLPYEKHLQNLWETKKTDPNIDISFRSTENPFFLNSIFDELLIIFQENDLEYLVSPYDQFHQLYYMLKEGIINCMYTSNDALLLQNLDNFILNIDFNSNTFHYLDNKKVLNDMNLNFKQFRDISMCVGNAFQPFQLITGLNSDFNALAQSNFNGSFSAYNALSNSNDKLTRLIQGCAALDYPPVLKVNGRVEHISLEIDDSLLSQPSLNSSNPSDNTPAIKSLNDKKIPSKLIEIFGVRLPDEFYFYQSIGLNVFHLAETFLTSNYVERLPLDMTTDTIYEKIIFSNASMKYKELMFHLLTGNLNRYVQSKKLVLRTYFKGVSLHTLDFKIIPPAFDKVKNLVVRHTTAKSFDLPSVLSNLNNSFLEESTFASPGLICSNHEIISTALLRTLTLYPFIENGPYKLSKWGIVLSKYIQKYNTNFESILLLCLFIHRFPDLDLKLLSTATDLQFNKETNETYDVSILNLIAKFSTLYKIQNTKSSNYTGTISRSLLHFHSIMKKLHDEIRDLITVNVLVLLFGNKNDIDKYARNNNEWCSLATEIPFKSSMPSTLAGLLVSKTIETFVTEPKESFRLKLESNLASYSHVIDHPVRESLKALKFVLTICNLITLLGEEGLVKEPIKDKFNNIQSILDDIISLF